jgi:hypothetical protein
MWSDLASERGGLVGVPKDLGVQGDLLGVLRVLGVRGDLLGVRGDIDLVPSARGATVFLQIMYCRYLNASMHFHISLFGGFHCHCRLILLQGDPKASQSISHHVLVISDLRHWPFDELVQLNVIGIISLSAHAYGIAIARSVHSKRCLTLG